MDRRNLYLYSLIQMQRELDALSATSRTKKHPHTLSRAEGPARYYGPGRSYRCDICNRNSISTVFHCDTCGNYDNCPTCFWKYQNFRHSHSLSKYYQSPYQSGVYLCDLCGAPGSGLVYHCNTCGNYDNCKECYESYQLSSVGNHAIGSISTDTTISISNITSLFKTKWTKYESGTPTVSKVILFDAPDWVKTNYQQKLSEIQQQGYRTNETLLFHGTKLYCTAANCYSSSCNVCEIKRNGFLLSKAQSNITFARFGKGLYFAPHSSKANDYTSGTTRAAIVSKVILGHSRILTEDETDYQDTEDISPQHSVYAKEGTRLNYPECVVYDESQVLPVAVVLYTISTVSLSY